MLRIDDACQHAPVIKVLPEGEPVNRNTGVQGWHLQLTLVEAASAETVVLFLIYYGQTNHC